MVFATAGPCAENDSREKEASAARTVSESAPGSLDVAPVGSGQGGDRQTTHLTTYTRARFCLGRRRAGIARLEHVDPAFGERLRDEQLRIDRHRPGVAQSGVVEGEPFHFAAPAATGSRFAGVACGTSRLGSHGIISRSRRPTCSMRCCCSWARLASRFGAPLRYSAIHFLACVPSLMSRNTRFISSRTRESMIRGPTV